MVVNMDFIYRLIFCICILISTVSSAEPVPSDKINFLVIADIHFNPFTSCGISKVCPLIKLLRNAPASQWSEILAKYDVKPPQLREDTNYPLLTSSLAAAKEAANTNHVQFVLLLGDYLGHEYYAKYNHYSEDKSFSGFQSFTRKTMEFLGYQISAAFPANNVYFVIGNNDSYQGDYFTYVNGQFFNDVAKMWSGLIKNPSNRSAMQKQFPYAGYYSVVLPYPGSIRLIALNSIVFSYKAKGRDIDKLAQEQLNWLHKELETAKVNHESVFIAMHIPEGIDVYATLRTRLFRLFTLWKPSYIQRFQKEINSYASEITGIFAGHLHADMFRILTTADYHEIPMINVASISPNFGSNPGFKLCTYSTNPVQLDGYVNYSFPLNGRRTWNIESRFGYNPN